MAIHFRKTFTFDLHVIHIFRRVTECCCFFLLRFVWVRSHASMVMLLHTILYVAYKCHFGTLSVCIFKSLWDFFLFFLEMHLRPHLDRPRFNNMRRMFCVLKCHLILRLARWNNA